MSKPIYADHAATTELSPAAYAAMQPWLQSDFGNPSTLYSLAREPRKAILSAREKIASCIGAKPDEVVFTSGGTEADNWALVGIAYQHFDTKGKIITSSIEHHAILHTCNFLKQFGFDIELLPVDKEGIVDAHSIMTESTKLPLVVSIVMANNEIGSIQPIPKLAEFAHQNGFLFHTDAVQAVGHVPVNVAELGVDMLSASAHKFNGPKGVGFLYVKDGVTITPLIHGGAQEFGKRAGTENVAGIVGMAAALAEHCVQMDNEKEYLNSLTTALLEELRAADLDFIANGSENRIPGSLSLSFHRASGEMLLHRLDLMGTAVATGSACNSKETEISHVIQAIRVPPDYAKGTIRITLGMDNDKEQMHVMARQISRILAQRI